MRDLMLWFIFFFHLTEWSVVYVIILSGVTTCGILALLVYQRCWKNRRRTSAGKATSAGGQKSKFRSAGGGRGMAKRRYTRLEQSEPGMELRSES